MEVKFMPNRQWPTIEWDCMDDSLTGITTSANTSWTVPGQEVTAAGSPLTLESMQAMYQRMAQVAERERERHLMELSRDLNRQIYQTDTYVMESTNGVGFWSSGIPTKDCVWDGERLIYFDPKHPWRMEP